MSVWVGNQVYDNGGLFEVSLPIYTIPEQNDPDSPGYSVDSRYESH